MPLNRAAGTPKSIIVLGDEVFHRDILAKLLDAQAHLQVIGQGDFSPNAMTMIFTQQPDLILADPCLNPEANLLFIQELLFQRHEFAVMLIATPCDTDTFIKFICAGISGVFLKTQCFDLLLKAIDRVLLGELWFERSLLKRVVHAAAKELPVQAEPEANLDCLSSREQQIVQLVVQGLNTRAIAETLHIAEKTVRNHFYSIYGKLEVSDRLGLARMFHPNGKP